MRLPRIAFLFVLAVAAAVVATGGASASNTTRVVGHVYVDDNTAPVNTVAGFDRLADGTLTPMPGSPFAVGGTGTGHPDASQGSLQRSDDGRQDPEQRRGHADSGIQQCAPEAWT